MNTVDSEAKTLDKLKETNSSKREGNAKASTIFGWLT